MGLWHVTPRSAPLGAPPAHHAHHAHTLTFRNPWDSAVRPNTADLVQGLQWGRRTSAAQGWNPHMTQDHAALMPVPMPIETPDFAYDPSASRAKATWLGHAGVLVQLPPVPGLSRPVRVLFDPILSERCSPSSWWGPQRTYAAPCKVTDLPTIDFVFISHNHYDHLDIPTIKQLWTHFSDTIHFLLPLKNKAWLLQQPLGIPADRITELDWWDEAQCAVRASEAHLRVVCTPAQHGSGRAFYDAGHTLWSSWVLEHGHGDVFRVFFGGDSGFCMHKSDEEIGEPPAYPECPAFHEIAQRIGAPDLSFLPVSVGATYAYLKSFDPLPDWLSPVPRLHDGLTGANHMTAADAVRVFQQMHEPRAARAPLAVAIHWGTFVEGPEDIFETVSRLHEACKHYGVPLARHVDTLTTPTFVLLHHGQSVSYSGGT